MRNSIGNNLTLTLFGESHGSEVGVVLDGMKPGLEVNEEFIATQLSRRRPQSAIDTPRIENDQFEIVSGVFNGYTTGAPICIIVRNEKANDADYEKNKDLARPSHADFVSHIKYDGYEDWRGGGHFSGRLTVGIVAAGAICIKSLQEQGIKVGTHILRCGDVCDTAFSFTDKEVLDRQLCKLQTKSFPTLCPETEDAMRAVILKAKSEGDSVGGIVQTAVSGLRAGVGEPWFDSLEGDLARALFAIGGVKGVEFGAGFDFARMRGSQANDAFHATDNGDIVTLTNNNGGINGGISNGMPVIFNCAVKPTSSIAIEQNTINLLSGENSTLNTEGRHDPAIIRRICPVISSMTAFVLCDLLSITK